MIILRLKRRFEIDGGLINKGLIMKIKYSNTLLSFTGKQQKVGCIGIYNNHGMLISRTCKDSKTF